MRNISLFFSILFLLSCTKELELTECENDQLIVVNSFFCADSSFRVHVSRTACFVIPTPPFEGDASIELYENDVLVANPQYNGDGWYADSFTPTQGNSYRVVVSVPELGFVWAESSIPNRVSIDSAYYYYRGKWSVRHQFYLSEIFIEFTDPDSTKRYYEVLIYPSYNTGPCDIDYMSDPSVLKDGDWDFNPKTLYFSNDLFYSQRKRLQIDFNYTPHYDFYFGHYIPNNRRRAVLRTISEEYYKSSSYWTKHKYNQQNYNNASDLLSVSFIGEPIEMYSNVQGGLGVFAGYTQDTKTIQYIPD